jgi:hypothetical protein
MSVIYIIGFLKAMSFSPNLEMIEELKKYVDSRHDLQNKQLILTNVDAIDLMIRSCTKDRVVITINSFIRALNEISK